MVNKFAMMFDLKLKKYQIGICRFSAKYAVLRCKSKNWSSLNLDNVSDWSDISTRRHVNSPVWVKPKTIKLVFNVFLPSYAVQRDKSKDWLAQNQDNVSE